MHGDALQTLNNISNPNREKLVEIKIVFRTNCVNPQPMATVKHKF